MSYNWKKHVKHSSKKNVNKRSIAKMINQRLSHLRCYENQFLTQQNAELKELLRDVELKLSE